eukprot:g11430.t1
MPGLVFRRRRLLLGGDELMLPYATSACGRMVWVLFLAVGLALAAHLLLAGYCHDVGYFVFAYEAVSVVVGGLSFVVECHIAKASTVGTIIDPGPRNALLAKHLSRKAALGAAQLVLGLCGTVLLFYVPIAVACAESSSIAFVTTGLVLTTISQFLDGGGMYCCFLAFTTADSIWIHDEDDEEAVFAPRQGLLAEMEKQYEAFCRTAVKWAACCSCAFNVFGGGEQEADFAHVSRVFGRMLSARRYVDVVATDVAAGLILLRHVQKAEDYKRRDELQGGPGVASYSTITVDPGIADVPGFTGSDVSAPSSSTTKAAVGRSHGNGGAEKDVRLLDDAAGGSGRGGGGGGGDADRGASRRGESWSNPGRLKLSERPRKHRKYYKVSRDETMLDLTEGTEDCRVLQEVAHFISYANVMYSVWSTLIIDPWSGLRRVIRRSGSWCPMFVSRRGARHRESLFRASSATRSASRSRSPGAGGRGREAPSILGGGGASVAGDDEGVRGHADDGGRGRRLSSSVPGLCEAEIRGDNWWGSHETALRSELPDGAELVLAHFKNCLDETPYCVAVDHTWQSIIITIRGTHSFEDFLVDAMAEPRSLESVGEEWGFDGSGMHAHEGILRRAEWIRRDLETSGVLQLLLGPASVGDGWGLAGVGDGTADSEDSGGGRGRRGGRRKKGASRGTQSGGRFSSLAPLASAVGGSGFCSGYTVRTIGHSLGGGVAALLALLLKPAYPGVRALAISPPGGLVSEGACREATEAMVTSVVLNDDVVPRMSAQSIEVLADQVLEVLGRSRVSKLFVMRSLLSREEEAHRPERYLRPLDSREGGGGDDGDDCDDDDDEASMVEQQGERLGVPLVGRRRPSDAAGPDIAVDGGGGSQGRRGGGARVGGEEGEREGEGDGEPAGELRYHRQLRRYREHLAQERGSRRHLHRLRLPGKILHLVNTEFVTETVVTEACDDGCLSCCCSTCGGGGAGDEEVDPCCCTPGVGLRRKRVFTPVWSSPTDLSEIRVTPAFLVDHSPDEIVKAVEQTINDLGVIT